MKVKQEMIIVFTRTCLHPLISLSLKSSKKPARTLRSSRYQAHRCNSRRKSHNGNLCPRKTLKSESRKTTWTNFFFSHVRPIGIWIDFPIDRNLADPSFQYKSQRRQFYEASCSAFLWSDNPPAQRSLIQAREKCSSQQYPIF